MPRYAYSTREDWAGRWPVGHVTASNLTEARQKATRRFEIGLGRLLDCDRRNVRRLFKRARPMRVWVWADPERPAA